MTTDSTPRNPRDYTVHMVGNAHIDPIWLWCWDEGYEVILATCRSALERMEETPAFIFSRSSAATYQALEERDPDVFEQIRCRVKEGRWDIVGGWWVQPDCNIPCGESFVRQALYGKEYFQQKLGVDVRVGYNVDSFGHCGTLPQILKKSGLDSYVFFRPDPREKELPAQVFWWEAPDGSRVAACRAPHHYNSSPDELRERILASYEQTQDGLRDVMCFYGVGDHGGGPTKQNIQSIIQLDAESEAPNVRFSAPRQFFKEALATSPDLATVGEELQYHSRGCYTALSDVKRRNRKAENLLMTAERYSAVAHRLFGVEYPQPSLERAWQQVLFNQFHDILAGTSIKPAYEDVWTFYEEATQHGRKALETALTAISSRIRVDGDALAVFNPLAWPRRSPVEAEVRLPDGEGRLVLVDSAGQEVPAQVIEESDGAARIVFVAEVPSLGYEVYRTATSTPSPVTGQLEADSTGIENEFFWVKLDPSSGHIVSIYDKTNDVEVLKAPGNVPIVLDDPSDTWSHGVAGYRDEIGCFLAEAEPVVVERGPVRAMLRVSSRWGDSSITNDIILYHNLPVIEFVMTVDWHERHRMLKLAFPIDVEDRVATYEAPYGHVVREATGDEEPGQRWIDVTGETESLPYGVSLLNDCKYGFSIEESEMRLSVLRSPIYAFHDPAKVEPGKTYLYTDQGRQTLHYWLLPHRGDWRDADTVRKGWEANNPLLVRPLAPQDGELPPRASFLTAEPDNVAATVLKKAQKSEELIVRLYETAGRRVEAALSLPTLGVQHPFSMNAYEIKTIKIDSSGRAVETNLLEEA